MNDREIEVVLRRYTERLAALGPVPEALGWTKDAIRCGTGFFSTIGV